MIKKLLLLTLLLIIGCDEPASHKFTYNIGEEIKIKISKRPAIIIDRYHGYNNNYDTYQIRYEDEYGKLQWENVADYEIYK